MTTKKAVALYVVCRGLPIHGTLSIQVQASCWNFLHIISNTKWVTNKRRKKTSLDILANYWKFPKTNGAISDIPYKNNTK